MKTTVVIMAAGIGSRFSGGSKQLTPVSINGVEKIVCRVEINSEGEQWEVR